MKSKALKSFLGLIVIVLVAQEAQGERIIANFEDEKSISQSNTTHAAIVSLIDDAPEGEEGRSVRTVVNSDAGAAKYFGMGFMIPQTDLSGAAELRFSLKTDIAGTFNFQIHSDNRVSVYRISTDDSALGKWQEFAAPVKAFTKAAWAGDMVDWSKVNKIQITAFGEGPYNGKTIILDRVVADGKAAKTEPAREEYSGPERRGGPITNVAPEKTSHSADPPEGFRSLFDGKTLRGWNAMPRLPIAKYPGAPFKMPLQGEAFENARANVGKWMVEDGAIVGGQDPPGSGRGAYLVTEEKFGDFELMMDMKPDWKVDSGFLVRTAASGSPGIQILVDHRPQGGIGGFYGNGLAGVHAMPFAIDAEYDDEGNPVAIISAGPDPEKAELNAKTRGLLQYAADVEDFLDAWRWGQWNTIKVRCEGRIPTLTTWVNGVKISVLEMSTVDWENYDAEACFEMLGRKGHISLEVHNSNLNHWLGKDRWWPGAVVRWKDIFIRELN
ncbi:MAG: DUF1080 domain-containing protein [Verrucomicrobiota bacterium]